MVVERSHKIFASVKMPALAAAVILSSLTLGCSVHPDTEVATSSVISRVGYSAKPLTKTKLVKIQNSTKRPVMKASSSRYLGRAPYICSPSGFGRTSTCFAR
jgi:hypothetical protein